jgi:hypothetical protein
MHCQAYTSPPQSETNWLQLLKLAAAGMQTHLHLVLQIQKLGLVVRTHEVIQHNQVQLPGCSWTSHPTMNVMKQCFVFILSVARAL